MREGKIHGLYYYGEEEEEEEGVLHHVFAVAVDDCVPHSFYNVSSSSK